ncbi:MAG: hypothetical protein WEA34_12330 [Gemmatimonadota bacterium]
MTHGLEDLDALADLLADRRRDWRLWCDRGREDQECGEREYQAGKCLRYREPGVWAGPR